MGSKNARGQAPAIRAAQAYSNKKAADKLLAEQKKEQASVQQLSRAQQKALTRQHAFNFNYDTLPKHSALKVIKDIDTGTVKLFVEFDIIYPKDIANDVNFLTVLPKYAELITKVEFRLVAPTNHGSPAIYRERVVNMMKTINCLNKFDIDEFQFVVSLNRAHNFAQMKLAAAAFGLNFKDWTMVTEVLHVKGRFNVDIGKGCYRILARTKELKGFKGGK
ncbi:predicted protein [Sclerotinia sclerotiorum 1980 UF-70]|uniref:Uncharacterized protein n=1 Tax=Sclerotinia sclerotiorum (strain ATCC 18683 / 1980 / Ss-1) TaxID=665079 RepID=A7ELT2_SCLS1|nr:predicted protein [Sclerotinia sclerotiorum 1980 UF-70]EDO03798.1 predicted protein [Sclerotinia sclerotiorum 1980 UF-70]